MLHLHAARRIGAVVIVAAALLTSGCAQDALVPQVSPTPAATSSTAPEPSAEPTTEPADPAPSTPAPSPEAPEPEPSGEQTATTPPSPATPAVILEEGDEGDDVRELQHRLLQIQWYEGKITGVFDEKTRLAVEGFQGKRDIQVTGYVYQETVERLEAMTREPTHDEMYNIMRPGPALYSEGDDGDGVKDIQARLKQIGWFSEKITGHFGAVTVDAVEGFQAKRGIPVTGEVDQRTKDRLYAMTRQPTTDELNNVVRSSSSSMTLDDRCLTGRVICVSKSQRRLAWVIDGKVQMTMDVRFGSELTPTRNGVFSVYMKSRDHVSSLYHTAMPFALFFSGGQAVHYSADFAARGYNGASHGCVNVRDRSAVSALFDAARVGDTVVVY